MLARVSAERENAAAQRASVEEESDAVSKRTVEAQADLDRHRARGMCASCARQVVACIVACVACIVHASFMQRECAACVGRGNGRRQGHAVV